MSEELDKSLENNQDAQDSEHEVQNQTEKSQEITFLSGMYEDWFLDYASYVILERAVPHIFDGLKPVQRRALHAMKQLDDGRYNKVANIIGHTMQYHPHGDASIGDALVQLGQKDLLIDTQGNWGNILTGDGAAASRYIEARLSKFALDVVFNPKTTEWKLSYDGRKNEPVVLPVKFPLLLAQGVEGIAVGLASKILPHNFNELIDAAILFLQEKEFEIYPDFPTGGYIDVSKYNDGIRGGKLKVRAKIDKEDNKTLIIREVPFGKNTSSLIESILSANEKGKIKIKKIDDNTAEHVEIIIYLGSGASADKTIDALYAFTDCEISISPNSCLIENDRPVFLGVSDILKTSTTNTLELLKLELKIKLGELQEQWHASSLEKIFIENRIYRDIEECETWESILDTIDKGLDPFKPSLQREVNEEDIIKLTEIKIKRISKYDSFKADELIKGIENEIEAVKANLNQIIDYTIDYYKNIKKKYGKDKQRKTEIRSFDNIEATKVVVANEKFYFNSKEGFAGTSLKKDEFLFECSDIDDIIIFRKDGSYLVTKVQDKLFVGKNVLHIGVFFKNDTRTIYNLIYRDGKTGNSYKKRFYVKGITRDKEYNVTQGNPNSSILYFTANPNGEAEIIKVVLKPKPKLKKAVFDCDFSELAIKGRNSMGNLLTKHAVHKIQLKEKGESTLGGRKIWFDTEVLRLNVDGYGQFLGEFFDDDKILVILDDGKYQLMNYDLSNHFEENIKLILKHDPEHIFSVVFYDADQKYNYLKRFNIESNGSTDKLHSMIGENNKSKMICLSRENHPRFEISFGGKHENRENEIIDAEDFIAVKSVKARGKRISTFEIKKIKEIEPLIKEEEINKDQEAKPESDSNNNDNQSQMSLEM